MRKIGSFSTFLLRVLSVALLTAIAMASPATAMRLVEDFTPGSESAWKPFVKSPAVRSAPDGLIFPLPFARPFWPFVGDKDRVAWDKSVSFDLSAPVAFELDLFCAHPDAMRNLGLYFKSGAGWYVANLPPLHAGAQTLTYMKSDFTTEGSPAGWNRIDGIRISPWRGTLLKNTDLILQRLTTVEDPSLVVIRGTSSCPDAASRAVAAKTADRISRLLVEAGLGHRIIDDDDLPKGALGASRVALLPYNPSPTPAQLTALRAFLGRGGKLGVFYSSSAGLASSMGFRLGPYTKAARPDRWRQIAFENASALDLPARIWQNSPNLLPVVPVGANARVAAWWQNARGERQPEAAVVQSDMGFWMSHILLSDDQPAKRDMLTVLCAGLDPAQWLPAARRAIRDTGRFNDYTSLSQAFSGIQRNLPDAASPAATQALLSQVTGLSSRVPQAMTAGRPAEAWRLARQQRRLLMEADASVQRPKPGEFIGVWDHDGTGLVPGDWPATADFLASKGVNAIFPNIAWGGKAHYPSALLPRSETFRLYGDQLAACLAAAAPHRQQVHAWVVLWKVDNAPPDFTARMKKEGRLQQTASGVDIPWLSPHHPANRALMLDVLVEIARAYPSLHGIHLDYVRLPNSLSCYSPTTRARFEAASRRPVARWPADVRPGGSRLAEFRRWRTDDITAFVAEARRRLRAISPSLKLSAAVYGSVAPDGGNISQYWPDWLKNDLVDFLAPMNYTSSSSEFSSRLRLQNAFPRAKGRLIPGIGVTADESRLDPSQTARQILLARQADCPGVILFSLSGTLRDETLPFLRRGITRPLPP